MIGNRAISRLLHRLQSRYPKRFEAIYYNQVYRFACRDPQMSCFNYGYAHLPAEDQAYDDANEPFQIEMYRQVALAAGPERLKDASLLEISSGLGGGLAFISRRFATRRAVGVERAAPAVAHARRRYGLEAVIGEALALGVPDGAFDVAISVEASHMYFGMAFLRKVVRALRPRGIFVLADFRSMKAPDQAEAELKAKGESAGLALTGFRDVTAHVARANELDTPRRERVLKRVNFFARSFYREMLTGEATEMYRSLQDRQAVYFIAVFEKIA